MRLTDSDLQRYLDKHEFTAVRAAFVPRRFPKGREVFTLREAQNSQFIVAKGRARVYQGFSLADAACVALAEALGRA